jgi:hypothetical protein
VGDRPINCGDAHRAHMQSSHEHCFEFPLLRMSTRCETDWVEHVPLVGIIGDLPARDFVVSPGFAGLAAVLAAAIAACAVLYASRRARQRFEQQRDRDESRQEQARHDAENALAWERWQWVVDTAGIEPAASEGATLGLGPAVTLELLSGLLRDAERLGDETLAKAVAVYQEQLLLVLAQQAGPVSDIAGATTTRPSDETRDNKPASAHRKPSMPTPTVAAEKSSTETPSATVAETSGGRRRR